ncbi:MAG: DUF6922 domain-containing protein [Minisyncoccota bacterium]
MSIPDSIRPFLWSYDMNVLDEETHRSRIIINILNMGDRAAVEWVFSRYSKDDIKSAIRVSRTGDWGKKSLNFWCQYFSLNTYDIVSRSHHVLSHS